MPGIDAKTIQDLLKRIGKLKETLESAGDEGQIKVKNAHLDDVLNEIPRTADGKFDPELWGGFNEEEQRRRHSKLSCVLGALKAAAGPGGARQSSGYGAALITTLIFLPAVALIFTLIIVLVDCPSIRLLSSACDAFYHLDPVWGALAAVVAWLALSPLCCGLADAEHAIPSSHAELLPRLDELEVGLRGFSPAAGSPQNPCKNTAYWEAVKEHDEIRKDLDRRGLTWVLGTGYTKVWGRLYRAEEAMIEVAPRKKVLEGAYYDEARLDGSDIPNHVDLLATLRKAVVSIDPGAQKYLKSTAAVVAAPALAIGTTALPGGTVAVVYDAPLLATGGVPPYKWAVRGGAIPDGLELCDAGVLRGTPTSDGHGSLTVQVTDSTGVAVEKYFDLLISLQTTLSPLAISTTTPLPWGTVGVEYAGRLSVTGGVPPYKWTVIGGAVPDGLQLSDAGVFSQRPLRDDTFTFRVKVTDSAGTTPTDREFTLLVKPSGATAAVPVEGTPSEQLARAALRHVRNSINEYRNARWNGLIVARNRLLATFMLTGAILFALLAVAIMSGADRTGIIAATVFYLVGGTVGLGGRLRSDSQAESAIPDYGLSIARLITIPLFSGLGAIGGLLLIAYLPFASPVFDTNYTNQQTPGLTQQGTAQPGATPAPAPGDAQPGSGKPTNSTIGKTLPPPPKLQDIFSFERNLIGLFVAMVFGLTPGLLFDRLQQQADKYKGNLRSSQSTGGTQKS